MLETRSVTHHFVPQFKPRTSPVEAKPTDSKNTRLDRWGAGLSLACAIHCAAQPLLLIILPMVGLGFLMNENIETLFLTFTVLLAAHTLMSSYKTHKHWETLIPWVMGTGFIILSRIFESQEQTLAIVGALSIAGSHLLNQYFVHLKHDH